MTNPSGRSKDADVAEEHTRERKERERSVHTRGEGWSSGGVDWWVVVLNGGWGGDKKEEETQNPNLKPPPPATSQISSNMSRYEAIKVPILKIHEYPIWKVRMAMCLEATYPEYLNRIYDGPHRPMKVAVSLAGEPEKMIDKDRKDYFPEDISSIMKDDKDSNLKFLLALPEKWDYKVTSIRDNYQLDITPLDEIYGVLKTHELEMVQRSKRKGSKARPVALKVEEKAKEKARRKSYSKGKSMIAKSDTKSSNSDDDLNTDTESDTDSDHNNNEDMDQMAALLVKSFKKMVYKNFKKGRRFSRKGSSSSNSDKWNNRRNTDGKESRSEKLDKSKERCYNCDGIGHFAADSRKPKAEKKQALISRKRNRDDSSDSDDGVNYALMAKADAEADNAELKVPHTTLAFDTDDIYELRLFLKSLHVSFRDQTLENNRIKSENSVLKKTNDHLETELLSMLEIQKEIDNAIYVKEKLLEKYAYLEKELAKEREVIKLWTNSGKSTQEILENGCWDHD
ncbi:hypothetical protein AgCh_000820 [Apium graveolens]